ncbi:iron transporter [Pseudomonas sp. 5P_3.1_Bac2]|uniref:iron transporter n=1 Tax=Pseudomonas sp. 5P_3.1_Bac2 TaxID=2971617 RepID=UPI0021CA074E|nr:iron transporter [Pseudomonas sp. 5P_3.1_Bac2]MCU1716740.1 iron transporter [Pseudomonas sp. 5P_3.1_Bac2]
MARTSSSAWLLTARCLLAVFGGYLLTYMASAALARLLPVKPVDAVVIAALLSFVLYLGFIIWSFAAARLSRVWLSLLLALPLGLIGFWPQLMGRMA